MLTITRSILLNFLELVGILGVNPSHAADKTEHLQTLFYNIHDLINQYRPHQARESLVLMMEEQLDRFRVEKDSLKESKTKMEDLMKTIRAGGTMGPHKDDQSRGSDSSNGKVNGTMNGISDEADGRREKQRQRWATLEEELG